SGIDLGRGRSRSNRTTAPLACHYTSHGWSTMVTGGSPSTAWKRHDLGPRGQVPSTVGYGPAMRLDSRAWVGVLAVWLRPLAGWHTAGAGGSVQRAPTAVLVMTVGLGGAGLVVGLLLGLRNRVTWAVTALVLLAAFYAGTWLNSPDHSI